MANDALIQTAAAPLWKEPKKGAERVDEALCGVSVEILESSGIYRRVRTCYGYEGWAEEPALFPPASLEAWKAAPKALGPRAVCRCPGGTIGASAGCMHTAAGRAGPTGRPSRHGQMEPGPSAKRGPRLPSRVRPY